MRKPLIGITTYYVRSSKMGTNRSRGLPEQDMLMSTIDYSRAIEKAGGIPVAIPVINTSDNYINNLIENLDGILFSGGADINPLRYDNHFRKGLGEIVPERDEFEFNLIDKALAKDKPILGICRGFQLLNTYFGGKLYQDTKTEINTEIEHVGLMAPKYSKCHKVIVYENSKLNEAYDSKEIVVNSFHHQAIKKVGEGLTITAVAKDGIVEGFEHRGYSFVVGVQWHPEMMFDTHDEQLLIFKMFINNIYKVSS